MRTLWLGVGLPDWNGLCISTLMDCQVSLPRTSAPPTNGCLEEVANLTALINGEMRWRVMSEKQQLYLRHDLHHSLKKCCGVCHEYKRLSTA